MWCVRLDPNSQKFYFFRKVAGGSAQWEPRLSSRFLAFAAVLEDNNFSGKFHLDGIPAAVCGCYVTEDTFDNDAHETFDVPAEEQVRCSEHRCSVSGVPGRARHGNGQQSFGYASLRAAHRLQSASVLTHMVLELVGWTSSLARLIRSHRPDPDADGKRALTVGD